MQISSIIQNFIVLGAVSCRFPERIFPRFKSGSQLSFPNFLTSLLVSFWPSSLQDVGDMSADNSEEVLNEFKFLTQSEVRKTCFWNPRASDPQTHYNADPDPGPI